MDKERALDIAAQFGDDLAARLRFIYELDELKSVLRQTLLADKSRQENAAEHSWHLAMTAMVLAPLADPPVDMERAIKMLEGGKGSRWNPELFPRVTDALKSAFLKSSED